MSAELALNCFDDVTHIQTYKVLVDYCTSQVTTHRPPVYNGKVQTADVEDFILPLSRLIILITFRNPVLLYI